MKASELIQHLANEINEHGDCTVVVRHQLSIVGNKTLQTYHHVGPTTIRSTQGEKQILIDEGALIDGAWVDTE